MWTFEQLTGKISNNAGDVVGIGYAGHELGKNNPQLQNIKNVGPLPTGIYTIEQPGDDPVVGRYAMRLCPDPTNDMYGRADFFIHGDNPNHIGESSDGCIVVALGVRQEIWDSNDHTLKVISGIQQLELFT